MEKTFYQQLMQDVRFIEGLKACMNCGVCTAICPAADFYNYDPRIIVDTVQSQDEAEIEKLLKSDTIWYCGECMSCSTRCPRGNVPGLIIIALRSLSQDTGYFAKSEKGRQQLAIKRAIGDNILKTGYCVHFDMVKPETHPEQGPVWEWLHKNPEPVFSKIGANYKKPGAGALRQVPEETLLEIKKIFDETGGTERFKKIESFSESKAREMTIDFRSGSTDCDYFNHVFTTNNNTHTH